MATTREPLQHMLISSSDKKFWTSFVNWLERQTAEHGATLTVLEDNPLETIELLEAQIAGMKIRIHDAESRVRGYRDTREHNLYYDTEQRLAARYRDALLGAGSEIPAKELFEDPDRNNTQGDAR